MLHKCANPACSVPFRRLDEGKLFQVEMEYLSLSTDPLSSPLRRRTLHHRERYWLCDACCSCFTLAFESGRGVVAVPLSGAKREAPFPLKIAELYPLTNRTRLAKAASQPMRA